MYSIDFRILVIVSLIALASASALAQTAAPVPHAPDVPVHDAQANVVSNSDNEVIPPVSVTSDTYTAPSSLDSSLVPSVKRDYEEKTTVTDDQGRTTTVRKDVEQDDGETDIKTTVTDSEGKTTRTKTEIELK